jgi:hypothetical protein
MNIPTLVEIKTDAFSAVLTKFNEMPASKVMPLMMESSQPDKQAKLAFDLFIEELAPDKRELALALNAKQVGEFIMEWMRDSQNA